MSAESKFQALIFGWEEQMKGGYRWLSKVRGIGLAAEERPVTLERSKSEYQCAFGHLKVREF